MSPKLKILKTYLDAEKKQLSLALLVLCLTVASFLVYLKFVGLPMTRAKNKFNEGVIMLSVGNKAQAQSKFSESLSYWFTSEAASQLEQLQ